MTITPSTLTLVMACLAVVEGLICATLLRRTERFKRRMNIAVQAAEDAARAAALAAPGGIDPEAVITLLRNGQPASLDAIYAVMEKQYRETARDQIGTTG